MAENGSERFGEKCRALSPRVSAKGYPPKSRSASGCISLGRSLRMRVPSGLAMPSLSNSAAASLTRSPAPDKWGSIRGTRSVGVSTGGISPLYSTNHSLWIRQVLHAPSGGAPV